MAILTVLLILTVCNAVSAANGNTTRVSVSTNGIQANDLSYNPSISADGRYITFQSDASNLVTGDTNELIDVFVHDQVTGITARISVAANGTQANGNSEYPSISADGRYITFQSDASNLVTGDTNGASDIFLYDQVTKSITLVSISYDGTPANNGSYNPSISADGRYITFESDASNLLFGGDSNGFRDIFFHNMNMGYTSLVSVSSYGTPANNNSYNPCISADGQCIAFQSYASNLVQGDTNGTYDIFFYNMITGYTTRVSVATDGTQANSANSNPSISADGRYITFQSYASNLVQGDTNGSYDIFVHDMIIGTTARVSVASDGTQSNSDCSYPSISADGRYIVFLSYASNLVGASDNNLNTNVFVHDQITGTTTKVSVGPNGTHTNGISTSPSISADGRYIAFQSDASNLVTGDTNGSTDIFVRDLSWSVFPGETIQAAINSSYPGQMIVVNGSAGVNITYVENLVLNSFHIIMGPGDGMVTIQAANINQPTIQINNGAYYSIIKGLTISGSANSSGININASHCNVSDNWITGNLIGIQVLGNQNYIINNTITRNGWAGIYSDGVSDNQIEDNTINSGQEGIYMSNSIENSIINNIITNNNVNGLNIQNGSENTIQDNTITCNGKNTLGNGVILKNGGQNNLYNNLVQNNGWAGIVLDGSILNDLGNAGGNIITDNQNGLVLYNLSSKNAINYNYIQNNLCNGLQLYIGCENNIIDNNIINNNRVTGLLIQNSSNNLLQDNWVFYNSYNGVVLSESNQNNLTGNHIFQNGNTVDHSGIGLLLIQSNSNSIMQNTMYSNVWTNIVLDSSNLNELDQNNINGNQVSQQGIMLLNGSYQNNIQYNTIIKNTASGINIQNSDENGVIYCTIADNGNAGIGIGILLTNSNSSLISCNNIQNNVSFGTCLIESSGNFIFKNNFLNNPNQAYDNSINVYDDGTTGNYWNEWISNDPRPITGGINMDHYPSKTPF